MIGFCPLASGSKGNSIFIGTKNTRLLIDAGISGLQMIERLSEIGVSLDTIQAVLVTHEHSDHIKGLDVLVERLKIPVFANAQTAKQITAFLGMKPKCKIFTTSEPFEFGDLHIMPFSIPHDTLDPVAFAIQTGNIKFAICADLGHATSLVKKQLERCDYLYLEANHQPSMVYSSARPDHLKARILGRQGHLSNEECGQLLAHVWHPRLKHVHLAHLSEECNTPEVALEVVEAILAKQNKSVELSISHQHKVSKPIYF